MHGLLPVRILRIKSMVEETACPGSKVLRHAGKGRPWPRVSSR
jgi:hypothetical protein